jgi:hypothetical protein
MPIVNLAELPIEHLAYANYGLAEFDSVVKCSFEVQFWRYFRL